MLFFCTMEENLRDVSVTWQSRFAWGLTLFNKASLVQRCLIENIAVSDLPKPLRAQTKEPREIFLHYLLFVLITPTLAN